jgi:cupin fold WbuC family metalloprotein
VDGTDSAYTYVADDVLYSTKTLVDVGDDDVALLKRVAAQSPRARARVCMHPDSDARQQQMLIVMRGDSYVAPHRHLDKSETFTVLEGMATTLTFDEDGNLDRRIPMGPFGQGRRFFYRMPEKRFHTLLFETDWLVYLETTVGPFDPSTSEKAPWAPAESDPEAGRRFLWSV